MPKIVYSHRYNIGCFGLERLHPFDSRKYGRAWRVLRNRFGRRLDQYWVRPKRPVSREELLLIHSESYLEKLRDSKYIAQALELPPIGNLPWRLVDWSVLRPMRWGTMGTILATRNALQHGLAINLSGGYHHAKPNSGEGFSIYCDIAIAIAQLRQEAAIEPEMRIAYVDLDAHQGNGVCHAFEEDRHLFIFDMYNREIYPSYDSRAQKRIDCDLGLACGCGDAEYLDQLRQQLPGFLDSISLQKVGLAVYNAGTDVLSGDPLGAMNVSAAAILERDVFVIDELRARKIPTIMVLSGGYTKQSYQIIADSVSRLLERTL